MTLKLVRGFLCMVAALGFGLAGGRLSAQESVTITDATAAGLESVQVEVLLTNDVGVQGFVLAIGYDTSLVSVSDVGVDGSATDSVGAELVVAEIFDALGGFTLGVVLDSEPPFDGQVIGPGSNLEIANFDVTPDVIVAAPTDVAFDFVDGTFNSPILDNILVENGESISIIDETTSSGGTVTLLVPPPDSMDLGNATIPVDGEGSVAVLLSNSTGPVQGFVTAVTHPSDLDLEEINIDGTVTDAVGAEFVVSEITPGAGGTLAVVLDFESPFDGQTIPVGINNHIANYVYSCEDHPTEPDPATTHTVQFEDGELGSPLLDNVIVVAGLSLSPSKSTGTVTCAARPLSDTEFYLGSDDGEGNLTGPHGFPGETIEVCWWYSDATDNIQGFQGAMCLPPESIGVLEFVEGSFSIEDTILDAVGTEFVNQSVDNNPGDGDGVEQVIGILLDALPPFDDQTAPQTATPLVVGCFQVTISEDADCSDCYGINFCEGVDGSEAVELGNLVVIDFTTGEGAPLTHNTEVCIDSLPSFVRADCNGSASVNLADAAAVLGYQFHGFAAPCLDACDANNDGKINLADTVYVLNYLYKSGDEPPAPFPSSGTDSLTPADNLDCEDGTNGCS